MQDVLELLKEMGAKNIDFDKAPNGEYSTQLAFEYKGKRAVLYGEWFNTQGAGIGGEVEDLV